MEAFSLLKFWRGGGGGGSAAGSAAFTGDATSAARSTDSSAATTILTAVAPHFSDSDSDSETASDADGPFFDLEFTAVPDEEDGVSKSGGNDGGGGGGDQINGLQHAGEDDGSEADDSENEEGELNLTFSTSSASSVDRTDPDVSLSPSDDLFFKGRLVPVESSSLLLNETEANSKFPVSLVKTATKFRVLMLKLKKPKANAEQKPEKSEPDGVNPAKPKPSPKRKPENEKDESQSRPEKKFFTVRFKVEEVNIKSLFTRDNSSKNANNGKAAQKTNAEDSHSNVDSNSNSSSSSLAEEKKFSKEMMQKYLKMVKPLYIRVSKRYGEKLRFSGQLSLSGAGAKAALVASPPPQPTAEKGEAEAAEVAEKTAVLSNVKSLKQGNLPAGLRVVRKHLSKSRSAPSPVVPSGELSSRRRDDSLLQQQDGIQSAILHCKRSFNSTRDSNLSILSRTTSDASHEKPINLLAVADDSSSPKEAKPQSGKNSIQEPSSVNPSLRPVGGGRKIRT